MYDLIVIGAGPGGYVAAVRAAHHGMKVLVIERDAPGGVCLNWGCIPSKNLIHQADLMQSTSALSAMGVGVDVDGLDYAKVQAQSRIVVDNLTRGVSGLMKRNGIEYRRGVAEVVSPNQVSIDGSDPVGARHILIATGSRPMEVLGFEFDETTILSSTGILAMTELPESLVILGGGAIGCEFAYVMASFGVSVTLVEAASHLLPQEDFEVCAVLEQSLKASGVAVLTQCRALGIDRNERGIQVSLELGDGSSESIQADKALVVFGRVPNSRGLGLESLDIDLGERGHIEVNSVGQTSVETIYAIGDVTSGPALAHVASAEGERAVDHMAGALRDVSAIDPLSIPSAIYCEPQVAGFGLRETGDGSLGETVRRSVFPYHGAGKSIAVGKPTGLVKLLTDSGTGELVGAHIVGHNATELIHEFLLARSSELLSEDITQMIHAHPTLSEAVLEAARGVNGRAIHA